MTGVPFDVEDATGWQVGDTSNKSISWKADGDVPRVWLYFSNNGSAWVEATDPTPVTGGVASSDGDNFFYLDNWYDYDGGGSFPGGEVPDAKSHICQIRVQDAPEDGRIRSRS